MAVGKIASSTANYGTLGKTSVKNTANGFGTDTDQFTSCEVFAPSLNLGVSVINTVAPATQGYTSYTQGPGIEGGVGYSPTFTENNITIIKPDSLPTNPAFADNRKFDRYQTSMLDMARGLSTSVIIGGDLFTTQNFYKGGLNTPNSYYMNFDGPVNIVGQQNFVGVTATMDGYPNQSIGNNNIFGTNNCNLPKRPDGTFAFLYPDHGYTLGYGENLFNLSLMGSNNLNGFITEGYNAAGHRNQVVIGNNNFNSNMNTGQAVTAIGLRQPKITGVQSSVIIGNGNGFGRFVNENNYDGTYGQYPKINVGDQVIIGEKAFGTTFARGMVNFIAAGAGDLSSQQRTFNSNTIICSNAANQQEGVVLRKRYENSPGNPFTFPDQTQFNIVIGGPGRVDPCYKASNSQSTIAIGHGIFGNNDSSTGYNVNGFANVDRNVVIGNEACVRHGATGIDTSTVKNVIIGDRAQNAGSVGMNNCIVIGANASATVTGAQNEITLGDSNIATLRCNVTSITSLSDARDKTNIEPISNASAFIKDLKPVKFDWDRRDGVKAKEHDMGFLAQDLDDAQSKHGIQDHLDIVYKSNPEALEASYGKLLPILVQALKEQQEEIEKLKSTTN